jgi:hypothetical protein
LQTNKWTEDTLAKNGELVWRLIIMWRGINWRSLSERDMRGKTMIGF